VARAKLKPLVVYKSAWAKPIHFFNNENILIPSKYQLHPDFATILYLKQVKTSRMHTIAKIEKARQLIIEAAGTTTTRGHTRTAKRFSKNAPSRREQCNKKHHRRLIIDHRFSP
jgi:hypothetical protein